MKRVCWIFLLLVFSAGGLFAAEWSGVLDSTVNYTAGTGEADTHSFGLEQFANVRLRIRAREMANFYAAFNLIAVSGNYLETAIMLEDVNELPLLSTPFVYGQNYAAALELERLYFTIAGEYIDTEAGLLRMNFGYGQIWGSSDFLNPRNPLTHNARPRGVLGFNSSFYPSDTLRLLVFAAGPNNPLETEGRGFMSGLVMDQHWDKASLQLLYAYETPGDKGNGILPDKSLGIHNFGLSLKFDLELGFVADVLYSLNPKNLNGIDSLSAGIGFDYSFLGGDFVVMAEYLYNGFSSVTALGHGGNWQNNHYLYESLLYRFNDFITLSLAGIFCFDDGSFQPIANFTYEFLQGFTLNLNARVPLDQTNFGGSKAGELGPLPAKFILNAGIRMRF